MSTISQGRAQRHARLRTPIGTFDELPEHAALHDRVVQMARDIFTRAGHARIDTPAFESTELFVRGVGGSTDIVRKQMYYFADAGGRSLALRPEGTAAICRAYVQHGLHKRPAPSRFWFHGSYFRQETPQAGRFRQFTQLGVEVLGAVEPVIDAESIVLLTELIEAVGVRRYRLRLSSLGRPHTRQRYLEQLTCYLRAEQDRLSPEVRSRLHLNPLRAFDSHHAGTQAVMRYAPRLLDHLDADDVEHFATVRQLLDGDDVRYEVDHSLVRGLDYYTRTVFEFSADDLGAQNAIGGGGRFDDLVEQLGGPPTGACGGCVGVERLMAAMPKSSAEVPATDLMVAFVDEACAGAAFRLATAGRRQGLRTILATSARSYSAHLSAADRAGARYVAVVQAAGVRLKDLRTGELARMPVEHVLPRVRTA
jgi:histidyl-tRNA synthetase